MACKRVPRLVPAVLAGLLAVLCALCALAEEAPAALSIEFTAQPAIMVDPGEVTLTFVLENVSAKPVRNIVLASGDGLLSEPIGQLAPGESQTLVRPHTVTEAELSEGRISYAVTHDAQSDGDKAAYALTAPIQRGTPRPEARFTRQLSSRYVTPGGLVTLTYKLDNTGNVPLTALRLRDPLGDFTGRLERLDVGERKTFISRVTLHEAAASQPVLEYETPAGETVTTALDEVTVGIADSTLEASFSVGRSVFESDTADAILILTNAGNVDYTGVKVLDDVYGGVIADAISLPAGGAPVEVAHTYALRGEDEFRWRITGRNGAGESLEKRTETLTLKDADVPGEVAIELTAAARTPRLSRPGRARFDIAIANTGDAMARDALLYEVTRGELRTLAVVPPGPATACEAEFDVTGDERFIFCLSYTDAQDRRRTVTSAPVDVTVGPGGVDPDRQDAPDASLAGQPFKPGGSRTSFIVLLVIAGAALTVMFTLLAATSVRSRRDRLKRVAAEKQRLKAELDKTGSIPAVKAPKGPKGSKPVKRGARKKRRGE